MVYGMVMVQYGMVWYGMVHVRDGLGCVSEFEWVSFETVGE